jgi:hypothetical protein
VQCVGRAGRPQAPSKHTMTKEEVKTQLRRIKNVLWQSKEIDAAVLYALSQIYEMLDKLND